MEYVCYVLVSSTGRHTYAGCTNNHLRRLRQHNGKLAGGARATRSWRPWRVACMVRGFGAAQAGKVAALRFEWRCKQHRHWHRSLRGPALQRRRALVGAAMAWAAVHLPTLSLTVEHMPDPS